MRLIFIHGPIAAGKLTVASQLAKLTGFKLFHNHLTVDLALSLFEFGSQPFIELREFIWLEAFRQAVRHNCSLIFTFSPESTVQPGFPERVKTLVESLGGFIHFIQLQCNENEIERRIEEKSRTAFKKLNSITEYRRLQELGAFEYPELPVDLLVDSGLSSAPECAKMIHSFLLKLEAP